MIVAETDRVDVIEFILPVARIVTSATDNPTEQVELVADLFYAYIDHVAKGLTLVPFRRPERCSWPANVEPHPLYQCWQAWFAQVVTVDA